MNLETCIYTWIDRNTELWLKTGNGKDVPLSKSDSQTMSAVLSLLDFCKPGSWIKIDIFRKVALIVDDNYEFLMLFASLTINNHDADDVLHWNRSEIFFSKFDKHYVSETFIVI